MPRLKPLTRAEKETILEMCSIAEANYDLALMNDPIAGEGDYECWTKTDFERAAAIARKMVTHDE
jgi:hypothetical protein